MTKNPVKRKLPYFLEQRIHRSTSDMLPELIKPESDLPRTEGGMEDILRWADDGGKMLDLAGRTTGSNIDDARKWRNKR